jgi:flagellar biosynthesis repressor protein FlbT
MSGLFLKLAPGERFVVNGAVLENCDRNARIRIDDSNARVLRCSDAIRPDQVDTAVKQVYFAVQLIITGDVDEAAVLPAVLTECRKLEDAFSTVDKTLIPVLCSMLSRGNFYSALCHLKQIISLEAQLLAIPVSPDRKVA